MDSSERKRRLQHALRKHHGKRLMAPLNERIVEFGGDPHAIVWLDPDETDLVLDSYADKYGSPSEDQIVLRVPRELEVRSRSWRHLQAAASELAEPEISSRDKSLFLLFYERWYLGAAKILLGQLIANLVPFALADGEVVAAYSMDLNSGLILDVIVHENESVGGEIFLWGPDLIDALVPRSDT